MKLIAIAALLLAAVLPSSAAEPTVEELSQRVAQLGKTVGELSKALALVSDKPEARVVSLPQPVGAAADKPEIIVNLHADGGLVVEGRKLSLEELKEKLKDVAKRDKDQPIRLRCDASVTYQRVVEVIDGCQEAGLSKTSFATPHAPARDAGHGECEDKLEAEAVLDPTLNSEFFSKTETRRQPWIVEHSDGGVEDASDGKIDANDLLLVERTANCTSTHQGEHAMDFCDAVKSADGLELEFWGGLPAYFGFLTVRVDAKHRFTCEFKADYPSPPAPLRWVVRKKAVKLKDAIGEPGSRIRGWISVEFDEIDVNSGAVESYKIEGFFKPVILNAPDTATEKDE